MSRLGVIECFFGPPWPAAGRTELAGFLARAGYSFYMYGPKADGRLRKHWREEWPREYVEGLGEMAREYRQAGIHFSVALSPFGLQASEGDLLRRRVEELRAAGAEQVGIFFDDMKAEDGLAARQLAAVEIARESGEVLFCPTYYSDDPILDRVFGARPPRYLEELGRGLASDVAVLWTGPKVRSEEIPAAHLAEVARTLRRAPVICDNFFANDGPKHCKFLPLRPLTGRSRGDFTGGWAFNPMNQLGISRIALLSVVSSLEDAIRELCSPALAEGLAAVAGRNLDEIPADEKARLISGLAAAPDGAELVAWLRGGFDVGAECLTD